MDRSDLSPREDAVVLEQPYRVFEIARRTRQMRALESKLMQRRVLCWRTVSRQTPRTVCFFLMRTR
jgi:hypothetical protein